MTGQQLVPSGRRRAVDVTYKSASSFRIRLYGLWGIRLMGGSEMRAVCRRSPPGEAANNVKSNHLVLHAKGTTHIV